MKNDALKNILNFLNDQRGFDFTGYRTAMLERRIQKRLYTTKIQNIDDYLSFLHEDPDELDYLIDVFTINVSRFFRNSLSFEHIRKTIIPEVFLDKIKAQDQHLRIWSAGCSFGEEPYSMAILINEFVEKEKLSMDLSIFATDIDKKALKRASEGSYTANSIKNVKYGLIEKYFTFNHDRFEIDPKIKKMVRFSFYDMLDKHHSVPSESIYGGFDLVLCRNVLIYFELEHQKLIFNKLYKSLNPNGYLILGEAEVPIEGFKHKFNRVNNCCKIYRKIG
ncbi:MAG: protein-glutamate O-methyltransferase CheR [Bacteroidetes bacterium]|nr:protein-glutamate O-methyltransferase CheR [Bacteroidota bacterium]